MSVVRNSSTNNRERFLGYIRSTAQRGMSLFEIIFVVAIIGGLMAYMIRNVVVRAEKAKIGEAQLALQALSQDLDRYRSDNGAYPLQGGLQALLVDPSGASTDSTWKGPYSNAGKLMDPWLQSFNYSSDGTHYKIWSYGKTGKAAGNTRIGYSSKHGSWLVVESDTIQAPTATESSGKKSTGG